MARLIDFCGADPQRFRATIPRRCSNGWDALTEPFFSPEIAAAPPLPAPALRRSRRRRGADLGLGAAAGAAERAGPRDLPQARARLAALAGWRREPHGAAPSRRVPGQPAFGRTLFSLMQSNPQLMDLLVDICGSAPQLARYLARNPRVLDAVLSQDFYRSLSSFAQLRDDLAPPAAAAPDYETKLGSPAPGSGPAVPDRRASPARSREPGGGSRIFGGGRRGPVGAVPACDGRPCHAHGPPAGAGAVLVAMGKLGSREMTVSSDLDLIVIYDAEGSRAPPAKRPLGGERLLCPRHPGADRRADRADGRRHALCGRYAAASVGRQGRSPPASRISSITRRTRPGPGNISL